MSNTPPDTLKIALAQLNPVLGDLDGNAARVRKARETAAAQGADLVVFPELFISGYPPEDLVLKPAFQRACREAVEALARDTADGGPALVVGAPWPGEPGPGAPYNAVALLAQGKVQAVALQGGPAELWRVRRENECSPRGRCRGR